MSSNTVEMSLLLKDNSDEVLKQIASKLGITVEQMKREIEKLKKALMEFEIAAKRINFFERLEKQARANLPKVSDEFKKMTEKAKKSFEHIQRYARRTFMAMAVFSGIALKSFGEYDDKMRKIQTISKDSYKTISTHVRKLAYETGESSEKIADGLYDVIQVVQDIPEKYRVLETASKLSIAGATSTISAVNLLTAGMQSYNLTIEQTEMLSNKLVMAQTKGNTTIGKMATQLGKVFPISNQVGVSIEQVLASVSTLTAGGIRTEQATTGIRAFLTEMQKSTTEASKLFIQLKGMDFKTYMENGGNIIEALDLLSQHAEKTGDNLVNIFRNIRSTMAAGGLVGMKEKYIEFFDAISNASADTVQKMYDKQMEGAGKSIARLKEMVKQYTKEIGQRIADDLAVVLNFPKNNSFEKMFNKEMIDKIYETGKAIFFVASAITALGVALKIKTILVDTYIVIKNIATAFGGLASGIGAVVVALGLVARHTKKTIREVEGAMPNLDNKDAKEKIRIIDDEIAKVDARLKELHSNANNYRNIVASETINVLEDKIKELNKIKKTLGKVAFSNDGYLTQATGKKWIKEENNENATKDIFIGKSGKNPFEEFISSIGAKIKNELNLEEKIEMLERAKGKFKNHIEEINIAIENFKGDLLKEKIENILKGISLDSHTYSSNEKLSALNKAKEEITRYISTLNPVKDNKKLKETKEQLDKIDLTIFNTNFNKMIENIKAKAKELKIGIENKTIDPKKATTEVKGLQTKIIAVKNFVQEAKDKGTLTDGDLEKNIDAIGNVEKGVNGIEKAVQNTGDKTVEAISGGLNIIGNMFSQLGAITGSKSMGGVGSIIGGVASMAGALSKFESFSSIGSMFSGGATALSSGMASLGAVAGGITAGIALVSTIGSLTGGAKGKKQKAKIDAENKRQLQLYEQNSKHLAKLTEVIINNSRKLETFADRLSDNISKNPTLNRIAKGKGSLINLKDMLVQNKVFGDISAVQKGHTYYKKSFGRVGRTDTYVNRILKDKKLLKYLGFNGNSKSINEQDFYQLVERANTVTTKDINRIYNNHDEITKSNVDVWVKNIQEWGNTIKQLSNADSGLFKGATMGSFFGIDYKSNMQLIKEYKDMLKGIGIDADKEQYKDAIQSMIEGNNVLITSMQDVRNSFIDGFSSGKESSFLNGMKSYFNNIFKNVSSVIYDVKFSDVDDYFTKAYEKMANRLVDIKTSGKLDFSNLFKGLDLSQLKSIDLFEKQYKEQIDKLKDYLFNSGVDLSIINKILPGSDFNSKINELAQALSNAMNSGIQEHSFDSFTKTLGQSLYENTKNSLIKAFSESKLYQSYISKFINLKDIQKEIEVAGTFKKAYGVIEAKLKEFGYRMEANGFGGFDAINNKLKTETTLGNAYYTDKNQNVKFEFHNNYYGNIYGYDDFEDVTSKIVIDNIKKYHNRPRSDG